VGETLICKSKHGSGVQSRRTESTYTKTEDTSDRRHQTADIRQESTNNIQHTERRGGRGFFMENETGSRAPSRRTELIESIHQTPDSRQQKRDTRLQTAQDNRGEKRGGESVFFVFCQKSGEHVRSILIDRVTPYSSYKK
jgi:hypothetical protein